MNKLNFTACKTKFKAKRSDSIKEELRVENLFIFNCLEKFWTRVLLSKYFRIYLKCINHCSIHQLPFIRCSFTDFKLEMKSDLDPRLSISFSLILWLVTLPE